MQLGWVDFSKADRDKVHDVMSMLKEQGAVDEIGIGVVRDAFSNLFFPGTSTIQTIAKYFLIVPYILKEACGGKYGTNFRKVMGTIDEKEKECGTILLKNCPDSDGIIGKRVLPQKWVSRTPSDIYWNGIRTFGICKQDISIPELVKNALLYSENSKAAAALGNRGDSSGSDDADAGKDFTAQIFSVPDDYYEMHNNLAHWKETLRVNLTPSEAEFLRIKIESSVHDSLLCYILKNNIDVNRYDSFEALYEGIKEDVPSELEENMCIACEFNRLVYSARVRYNYILSRGRNQHAVEEWEHIADNAEYMMKVDIDKLFFKMGIQVPKLRIFLNNFKNAVLSGDFEAADKALINREKSIKGPARAKLLRREDFADDEWVGGRYLDYRFFSARRIINDIYKGEGRHV